MEQKSKNKLTLFADNWQTIRKEFKLHNAMTKRLAALLYAQENKAIDCTSTVHAYSIRSAWLSRPLPGRAEI
jgi:hypothetical protein